MSEAVLRPPVLSPALGNILRLLALPLIGFVGLAAGSVFVPSSRIGLLGISIATGVLVLGPVVLDRTRPPERRHLLLTFFSLAYAWGFVLPGLSEYLGSEVYVREGSIASIRALQPDDIVRGQMVAFVGYAALLLGYALPFGRIAATSVPKMGREWSHVSTLTVASLMIPLGWAITLAGQLGLIPARAGSGALGTIGSAATFGLALLAICYHRYRSWPAVVILVMMVPTTMAFNFFTGSKTLFLMPLAMIATAHIVVTRRLRLWWFAGFFAAIILLYPISEIYRDYINTRHLGAIAVLSSPHHILRILSGFVHTSELSEYLSLGIQSTSARLDILGIESVIVRDAGHRIPFQGGWSLSYVAIAWVPRVLWPGKPIMTIGQWVTDFFGPGPTITSSTGPSWVGEFYFNFGWTGVAIGMAALGLWLRFLQESLLGLTATIPALLAGVTTIFQIVPTIESTVVAPVNNVIFRLIPIVLTHLVVRAVTRPPVPERTRGTGSH